jgi:hypothetical protein
MRKLSPYFDYKLGEKDYKIRFKTPTVGEQIAIGQNYAALKGGFNSLDEISDTLAFATATLSVVIDDKPSAIKFEELDSEDWKTLRQMLVDYQQFAFFRKETPAEPTTA